MLKRLCITIAAFACFALAQSTTPNIGLQLPAHGASNWDSALNSNFSTLDELLGGQSVIPYLSVQSLIIGSTASQPGCSSSNRGQLWFVVGTGGSSDALQQCLNTGASYAWQAFGGGSSGGSVSAQFTPAYATGITFGSCSGASPCYLAPNGIMKTYTSAPTVTPSSGTNNDTLWVYGIPTSNLIQVGYNSANTYGCNSGCQVVSGVSAVPSNAYGIYSCTVTAGVVVNNGCTPTSTQFSNSSIGSGLGVAAVKDPTSGAIILNLNQATRNITSGTTDTIRATDCGGVIHYSSSSAVTAQLPAAGLGSQFIAGCPLTFVNTGQAITVDLNGGSQFDGSTSPFTIPSGSTASPTGAYVVSDGTNYSGVIWASGSGSFNGGTIGTALTISYSQAPLENMLTIAGQSTTVATNILIGQPGIWKLSANSSGSSNEDIYIADSSHSNAHPWIVDPSNDILQNGTGFAPISSTVSFSPTPAFDLAKGVGQSITLTANVTSSSIAHLLIGGMAYFQVCQDATGGRTFAWPSNVKGAMTITSTASHCSYQGFYSFDGTNLYAINQGTSY